MAGSHEATTMNMLGEKAFLRRLIPRLHADRRLIDGHGHDATAIQIESLVDRVAFKIDRAAHPVAVSQGWSGYAAWGRMAVTANCSDLLAAGSSPLAFMVAITVPGSWLVQDVEDIVLGCQEECERNNVSFAGGDTKEGPTPQVVGSAFGVYDDDRSPLPRTKAEAGDKLVVAGPVGGFLAAALLLEKSSNASEVEKRQWIDYLAFPRARWVEANHIIAHCSPRAGMDTSDGIFDALVELTKNGLGLRIDLESVPFHPFAFRCADELRLPLENFLFGGGDWNILYALASEDMWPSSLPETGALSVIGAFTSAQELTAQRGSEYYDVAGPRHEHFRARLEDGSSFINTIARGNWFNRRTSRAT